MAPLCPRLTPGASLLIARGAEILLQRGYGWADIEGELPAGVDTAYLIASISKQFFCVAALLLAGEGKLDLDAPIVAYAPGLPGYAREVTLRHLMTHTSGIPDYFDKAFIKAYCRDDSPVLNQGELVRHIARRYPELEFAPGTRWAYSNSGYVILGQILEQAAKLSLADLLAERIFTPLDMRRTRVGDTSRRPTGMARGYRRTAAGRFTPTAYNRTVVGWADGNIISTCGDLLKWQQAWQAGALLPAAAWEEVFRPYPLPPGQPRHYGLGWFLWRRRGEKEYWHAGSTVGYHGHAACFPDAGLSAILLMNASSGTIGDPNIPIGRLVHEAIGDRLAPLPPWHPPPTGNLPAWTGAWQAEDAAKAAGTRFAIQADAEGRLTVAGAIRDSRGDWHLRPHSRHKLWIDTAADYYLTRDEAPGRPEYLTLHCHGRRMRLVRGTFDDPSAVDAPDLGCRGA